MRADITCFYCILKKIEANYENHEPNPEKKNSLMKKVFTLFGETGNDITAPFLNKCVDNLMQDEFGQIDDYEQFKTEFNKIMLNEEQYVEKLIGSSNDALLSALQFAMVGNFIDMQTVDDIKRDDLERILETAADQVVDAKQFEALKEDLCHAKNLVYLHDNSGEIVLDKVFLKVINNLFPEIHITCVVRGKPTINDATMRDAKEIRLDEIVEVIDNGTDIPGTQLDKVNPQTLDAINRADLIISKGQGNFETLHGCQKNVYYIFLCKCDLFVRRFGLERFTGVFTNEKNIALNQ